MDRKKTTGCKKCNGKPCGSCQKDKFEVVNIKKTGEVLLDAIIENQGGKGTIFGIPGSTSYQFDKILQNAIDINRLNFVHITNETNGAYSAQNFSNDKTVGVVITTRGPGITMAFTGIVSAFREEIPLIYMCGVSPTDIQDEFQNVDLTILSKMTKKVFRITKKILNMSEITDIINEAFFIAHNGTSENPGKGPIAILVDSDAWLNELSVTTGPKYHAPKVVCTGNEQNALYDIITRWNKAKSVVMRFGPRVNYETALKMVELANKFQKLYITSAFDARGLLSPDISVKNLDMSGPVGNSVANKAITDADLIIDAGVGVQYTTLVTDISKPNIIRLFDEPIAKDGYIVNVNQVLLELYKHQDSLNNVGSLVVGDPTVAFKKILDVYFGQNKTVGYYVAKCVNQFYNDRLIITDDYYQITDSGTAAFIAGQLLRVSRPDVDGIYTEYSAIGLSLGSASGKIYGNPKDTVVYIGDGAFMNMMSGIIDLKMAAVVNKVRALVLLYDDTKYGNVALGDKALFGEYTTISSTVDLLQQFNMLKIFEAVNPVKVVNGYDSSVITDFRNKAVGYTLPGLYVMKMDGITTPIVISQ
jgi:thiamine pyrophosphate-dependent acetolactate synthase large subunit-like protein